MKTIKTEGSSKLVEHENSRYVLPADSDDLDLAIPYGLPWEEICQHPAIPGQLRRRGIYTYEDLVQKHQEALNAIMEAYGQDLQTIMKVAKNFGGEL